jgi:methionine transaminase
LKSFVSPAQVFVDFTGVNFTSRLPAVGTTIFTTMSALAKEHDAINLSQGFPDFDCDPALKELATKYMQSGFQQYAPMPGVPKLRETISAIIARCYNVGIDPETQVTVTAGATQGIFTAIAAFIKPGDEVIVFEPAYDCYVPAILLQGGVPVFSRLDAQFRIDWDDVQQKITPRTRAVIVNSPHNPSGSILTAQDVLQLEKHFAGKDTLVISDEVYEHMVFDGEPHHSLLRSSALAGQSVVISSFGKTVHATGWKIGYLVSSPRLMTELRKVHQFLVFAVNHPLQLALADYLADPQHYLALKTFYEKKRDRFLSLTNSSRLKPLACSGTYFQLMDYSAITQEGDADFAVRLTKEKKLAAIPLSVFYHDGYDRKLLRFCFAKKDETLERAAEILCSL